MNISTDNLLFGFFPMDKIYLEVFISIFLLISLSSIWMKSEQQTGQEKIVFDKSLISSVKMLITIIMTFLSVIGTAGLINIFVPINLNLFSAIFFSPIVISASMLISVKYFIHFYKKPEQEQMKCINKHGKYMQMIFVFPE